MPKLMNLLALILLLCSALTAKAECRVSNERFTEQALLSSLYDSAEDVDYECAIRLLSTGMAAARSKDDAWDARYEIREVLLKVLQTHSMSDSQHFNLLKSTLLVGSSSVADAREVAADLSLLRRAKNSWSSDRTGPDYETRLSILSEELRLWCQLPQEWQVKSGNLGLGIDWNSYGVLTDFDKITAIAHKSTCSSIDLNLYDGIASALYHFAFFTTTFSGANSVTQDNPLDYEKQTGDSAAMVHQRINAYLSLAEYLYRSDSCQSCTIDWRRHVLARAASMLWWLEEKDEARGLVTEAMKLAMGQAKRNDQLRRLTDILNQLGSHGFGYGPSDIELVKIVADKIFDFSNGDQSESAVEARYYANHYLARYEALRNNRK